MSAATETRDSGIWPARCWPHWGGPGMDDWPRGDAPTTSLSSSFEPPNRKRSEATTA